MVTAGPAPGGPSAAAEMRRACLGLIAAFKAAERATRRRLVTVDARFFFQGALPLFEYLMFDDSAGPRPPQVQHVDPHLVLASRGQWRDSGGQLRFTLEMLARAEAGADSQYSGACFWQAGPLPLYIPYTGESRVEASAALGITVRAQVHPMIVPAPGQLRLRPIRAGGWALELLEQVGGRGIATPEAEMIRPLPFPAAVPVLRAYGVPQGPPVGGLGLRYRAQAAFDRHEARSPSWVDWLPPGHGRPEPDLVTRCDGTGCRAAGLSHTPAPG